MTVWTKWFNRVRLGTIKVELGNKVEGHKTMSLGWLKVQKARMKCRSGKFGRLTICKIDLHESIISNIALNPTGTSGFNIRADPRTQIAEINNGIHNGIPIEIELLTVRVVREL